jgi:hypothetical protein
MVSRKPRFIKPSKEELLRMKSAHPKLNSKYLRDADSLFKRGDYVQASEKYWGAFAQMIKTVAAERGIKLGEHRSIIEFVEELSKEHPDLNLADALAKAKCLHTNFYEDDLPHEVVASYVNTVKKAIIELNNLL